MFDDKSHSRMHAFRIKSCDDLGRSPRKGSPSSRTAFDLNDETDESEWDLAGKFNGTGLKCGAIGGLFENELKALIRKTVRDLLSSKFHYLEKLVTDNGERLDLCESVLNKLNGKMSWQSDFIDKADSKLAIAEEFAERFDLIESRFKHLERNMDALSGRNTYAAKSGNGKDARRGGYGSQYGSTGFLANAASPIQDSTSRDKVVHERSRATSPKPTGSSVHLSQQSGTLNSSVARAKPISSGMELSPNVVRSASATNLSPAAISRCGTASAPTPGMISNCTQSRGALFSQPLCVTQQLGTMTTGTRMLQSPKMQSPVQMASPGQMLSPGQQLVMASHRSLSVPCALGGRLS